MDVRFVVAQALEDGKYRGIPFTALARAYGFVAARQIERPLTWREGKRVIAIGGATLGGSGKTPLALATALHLARSGLRAVVVGHAYRATPGRARVVCPDDDVRIAGDEAVMCARALDGHAEVVVAPDRQAALDLAFARGADVAIVDGVLQTTPRKATLALLAIDARAPWGSGACPPAGDLRAPPSALIGACDEVVRIGEDALPLSRGAWLDGALLTWPALRDRRIGVVTAIARPARVLAALASNGVFPTRAWRFPDHGGAAPTLSAFSASSPVLPGAVDLWLATPKCRTGLPARIEGIPVGTLDYALTLGARLSARIDSAAHSATHGSGRPGRP